METRIGRKEIEEFGIVNVPAELNRFQRGKRSQADTASDTHCWEAVQARSSEILLEGERALLGRGYTPWFEASVPHCAGIYVVRSNDRLIYIGESSDIGDRHATHSGTTYFSALRRHIGTEILGFTLKTIKGKTRYLDDEEDKSVTRYLRDCQIAAMPVSFGRYELEEFLIKKHHPLLNRKENRSSQQ